MSVQKKHQSTKPAQHLPSCFWTLLQASTLTSLGPYRPWIRQHCCFQTATSRACDAHGDRDSRPDHDTRLHLMVVMILAWNYRGIVDLGIDHARRCGLIARSALSLSMPVTPDCANQDVDLAWHCRCLSIASLTPGNNRSRRAPPIWHDSAKRLQCPSAGTTQSLFRLRHSAAMRNKQADRKPLSPAELPEI